MKKNRILWMALSVIMFLSGTIAALAQAPLGRDKADSGDGRKVTV